MAGRNVGTFDARHPTFDDGGELGATLTHSRFCPKLVTPLAQAALTTCRIEDQCESDPKRDQA